MRSLRPSAAQEHHATVLGEVLGGYAARRGLARIRDDGDGLVRHQAALADAKYAGRHRHDRRPAARRNPDASGGDPKVFGVATTRAGTAFKWAIRHLIAAAGIIEAVVALAALREGVVPGIPTLEQLDPACAGVRVSAQPQTPRSDTAMILCRGFAGTNAALIIRAA